MTVGELLKLLVGIEPDKEVHFFVDDEKVYPTSEKFFSDLGSFHFRTQPASDKKRIEYDWVADAFIEEDAG